MQKTSCAHNNTISKRGSVSNGKCQSFEEKTHFYDMSVSILHTRSDLAQFMHVEWARTCKSDISRGLWSS